MSWEASPGWTCVLEELTPSQHTRVSQPCLCSGPQAARKSEKAVTSRLPFPEPRLPPRSLQPAPSAAGPRGLQRWSAFLAPLILLGLSVRPL